MDNTPESDNRPKELGPAAENLGAGREFHLGWTEHITDGEWTVYESAMSALHAAGIRFVLGGGFAQAAFTGRWRNTKDIDLYVLPEQRNAAIETISKAGLEDYYPRLAYDRSWIYRSIRDEVIVDLIWAMANHRSELDNAWFDRAGSVILRGYPIGLAPVEEFLWAKLYIVQRDRCDWVDVINLFHALGTSIDWKHLLERLDQDWPLLQAVLSVYAWLHPAHAARLEPALPDPLRLPRPQGPAERSWEERVRLLDSREWFGGLVPEGARLQI